ncbi:MAG: PASTA domain-containing protein [Crocinitomicaceae bacterium]|nr:PASTA domain-containing protein [Crocinitomicaceae bacterium]
MLKKWINFFKSRTFLINVGAIILFWVVLIWGTLGYFKSFTSHSEEVEVPNLINNNIEDLPLLLKNKPLRYEILDSIYHPNLVEGTIIYQDPLPTDSSGLSVKPDRLIKLRVSKQTRLVEVPNVVSRSERFAVSSLNSRGLRVKVRYVPSIEEQGSVINQKYKGAPVQPKQKLPINSIIELEVGEKRGLDLVYVPNLIGFTIRDAQSRLESTGSLRLFATCSDCATQADSLNAIVISQSPVAGDSNKVSMGSTITVIAAMNAPREFILE